MTRLPILLLLTLSLRFLAAQPTLEQMRDYLEQNPRSAGAHSNYGAALKAAGELGKAVDHFETAILLDGTYARAYNNLGNAKQAVGDYEGAVALHEMAITLMPELASAYNNLGNALRELARPDAAISVLTTAVQLNPTYAAAYSNLGAATQAHGDPQRAVGWHTYASRLAPTDPMLRSNLGAALEATGRLSEAAATFAHGLIHQPDSTTLRVNMGNVLRAQGKLDESINAFTEAINLAPTGQDAPLAHNNLAAAYQAAGQSTRAKEAYEAAIRLQPTDPLPRNNLDKLPISAAYRSAATYEALVLASRAARVAVALSRAARVTTKAGAAKAGRLPTPSPLASSPLASSPLASSLHRAIRYLRRIETEQVDGALQLWGSRAEEMVQTIQRQVSELENGEDATTSRERFVSSLDVVTDGGMPAEDGGGSTRGDERGARGEEAADEKVGPSQPFSLGAFAWGGVWYQTFAATLSVPECRHALTRAAHMYDEQRATAGSAPSSAAAQPAVVVLGSSIGFEAYFAALTYGVPTVGVEILEGLVDLSEEVRVAHSVGSDLVEFHVSDALAYQVPSSVALVYVDDTAWDAPVIEQLAGRLTRELRPGTLLVHNRLEGYEKSYEPLVAEGRRLRRLAAVEVGTSWDPHHLIYVDEVV